MIYKCCTGRRRRARKLFNPLQFFVSHPIVKMIYQSSSIKKMMTSYLNAKTKSPIARENTVVKSITGIVKSGQCLTAWKGSHQCQSRRDKPSGTFELSARNIQRSILPLSKARKRTDEKQSKKDTTAHRAKLVFPRK